jgi:hypothetical protein
MANNAEDEQVHVVKVNGVGEERFLFITMKHGKPTRMSYPAMSEEKLNAELSKMGCSELEITSLKVNAGESEPTV